MEKDIKNIAKLMDEEFQKIKETMKAFAENESLCDPYFKMRIEKIISEMIELNEK